MNPVNGSFYVQIDGGRMFFPDAVGEIGNLIGTEETTRPEHKVRSFKPTSKVALVEFSYNGIEYKNFYRIGKWIKGKYGKPCFSVSGLLELEQ
jgi:hypothetical protein